MAEEAEAEDAGGGAPPEEDPIKCEECIPGLPSWMATFSDLVTLLLTFFVLLLSFAKTETAKYEAALGSVRDAFGGNVLKVGETISPGKSPDDTPEMVDAQETIRPFPIEFLTSEGLLDKKEINRESKELLREMKKTVVENELDEDVIVEQLPEGVRIRLKDKIYFKDGSTEVTKLSRGVLDRMTKLVTENKWKLFVEGHASVGEKGKSGSDAFILSARRAEVVSRQFVKNGVAPEQITSVFYGDTRPAKTFETAETSDPSKSRRVGFILRKTDLSTPGNRVKAKGP